MADHPITAAVRQLREAGVAFEPFLYDYQDKGGTARSSSALDVPEHQVIKTLIMQAEGGDAARPRPLVVLMHGDRDVSTKELARLLNVKTVKPMPPDGAEKQSGYQVGGTSPFGLKNPLPIYAEKTIFELPWILINGGKRGFLVKIAPNDLIDVFGDRLMQVGVAT